MTLKTRGWMTLAAVCACTGFLTPANADNFVTNGTINVVSNSRSGGDAPFVLSVTGATGPCASAWIGFYPTDFTDADAFKRAFAIAMLAYTTGKTVSISSSLFPTPNAANGDCWHANYIQIQG